MKDIKKVIAHLNIPEEIIIPYGRGMAKIDVENHQILKNQNQQGHLVLVTAMSPTPKGEGKTTTTIGLGDALHKLQQKTLICLRQPSMGPCFGVKGGATGGGRSQLTPMESINLNFTGDLHAIGAAHNLLSSMIDNHIHWGNKLRIDSRKVTWRRVVDMNDRALRKITQSLGGVGNGYPREDGFDITVASEVMAIFCLASDLQDLQNRLGEIIIGLSLDKKPITAKDLKAHGAMAAILKNALLPNVVQTLEGAPAFVHGGPFANIAHGCNSVIATKAALNLSDFVVTEAGFGADLGAEKFLDIKCRSANIWPSCAVLVTTIRAIQYHGDSLDKGISNVVRHIENLKKFKLPVVVTINHFTNDSESDIQWVVKYCKENLKVDCVVNRAWAAGSDGALDLARAVKQKCEQNPQKPQLPKFLYENEMSINDKIEKVAHEIYRAENISIDQEAQKKINQFTKLGFQHLPICIAKTQYSFSSDPTLLGAPLHHTLKIKDVRLSAGAGFLVVICGDVMTMPGLPEVPSAENIFIDESGAIQGLF